MLIETRLSLLVEDKREVILEGSSKNLSIAFADVDLVLDACISSVFIPSKLALGDSTSLKRLVTQLSKLLILW